MLTIQNPNVFLLTKHRSSNAQPIWPGVTYTHWITGYLSQKRILTYMHSNFNVFTMNKLLIIIAIGCLAGCSGSGSTATTDSATTVKTDTVAKMSPDSTKTMLDSTMKMVDSVKK